MEVTTGSVQRLTGRRVQHEGRVMMDERTRDAASIIEAIGSAINGHDLEALVGCFTPTYRNETPVHPARSFEGREQVRRNWSRILGGVPDLRATLVRSAAAGDEAWAEWDWSGTRVDGASVRLRGVTIMAVRDGRVDAARFYMEPVDDSIEDVESVVQRTMTPTAARASR